MEDLAGVVAKAWCGEKTSGKNMDVELAKEFIKIIKEDRERMIRLFYLYDRLRCNKGCQDCDKESKSLVKKVREGGE